MREKTTHEACIANDTEVPHAEPKDTDLDIWHKRLAHVSRATISKMKMVNSVEGLEKCSIVVDAKASDHRIVTCCLAKQARRTVFPSEKSRATEVGQSLHVDICGPIGTPTL